MFFHKTGMLFLYGCFCHKHEEYNYEYCLFWQCFYRIDIGFFMFDAKELIENSIPILTKNIESVLLPCLVQDHEPNFVSASPMFFPMLWHQILINVCSATHSTSSQLLFCQIKTFL